ncbi:MAG: FGGY family carbohydrate kinase [Bacteroidota bacterium]
MTQKAELILIFDIGKTNKKALLFDDKMKLIHQEETKFDETVDDDGYPCDDFDKIEQWLSDRIESLVGSGKYNISKINFTTYGATLVYLDELGKRLTPVYNYLKPLDNNVDDLLYEKWGGKNEFLRKTASPALKMLNSGLQILKLKHEKPEIYKKIKHILHLPQYLSFLMTKNIVSEATSIGCHTALWNFDNMKYHDWLKDEEIHLPEPSDISSTNRIELFNSLINIGIGIHDSSASLVPYLKASDKNFVLISTGTWCVNMNPFNNTPLTKHELEKDCLNYMTYDQKPVKSSRVFLGHIHDVNVKQLTEHFNIPNDSYKTVELDRTLLPNVYHDKKSEKEFFKSGIPDNHIDTSVNYNNFTTFEHAYHQLIIDLALIISESINLIISGKDKIENLYITGGFARNKIFTTMIAIVFRDKSVYISEIDNATSLGAALVLNKNANNNINLGLSQVKTIL